MKNSKATQLCDLTAQKSDLDFRSDT